MDRVNKMIYHSKNSLNLNKNCQNISILKIIIYELYLQNGQIIFILKK